MVKQLSRWFKGLIGLPFAAVNTPIQGAAEASIAESAEAEEEKPASKRSFIGYSQVTPPSVKMEQINRPLQEKGYAPVAVDEVQGGGGGMLATFGKVIVDGNGYGLGKNPNASATPELAMGMGGGSVNFGYVMLQKRALRVYPMIGFGGVGGGVYRTDEKTEVMGVAGGQFNIGLGADVRLKFWKFGVMIGLRAGYARGLMQTGDGLDDDTVNGFYFRVISGSGLWF